MAKNRLLDKKTRVQDLLMYGIVYTSTIFVCIILFAIIGVVFWGGRDYLNIDFITSPNHNQATMIKLEKNQKYDFEFKEIESQNTHKLIIENSEPLANETIKDSKGNNFVIEQGYEIEKVNYIPVSKMTEKEVKNTEEQLKNPTNDIEVKMITKEGDGISSLIINTLFIVLLSLLISIPIGICAAIYLIEYDINPKINKYIHFAIDSLAGIPSIIFALFGMMFFSQTLHLGKSNLAGVLTVSIMLLPIIIKTVEEALINVPMEYREASLGLGANKVQTIFKIVLPAAIPGIMVATILSIGRVIGESAIFVFVVGTTAAMPSLFGGGATLTAYAYSITRESPDMYGQAYAIGAVIIIIVLVLNIITKLISKKVVK